MATDSELPDSCAKDGVLGEVDTTMWAVASNADDSDNLTLKQKLGL